MIEKQKKRRCPLSPEDVTLEMVKFALFGCVNCLWSGCECTDYSKFAPAVSNGQPTCNAYTYFD